MALQQNLTSVAPTGHNPAPATAAAVRASGHENGEEEEDLIASPASLWLPRTVVKRHRKRATIIWASLLAFFFAYVGYIVWDTMDSRSNPPASIAVKQEYFKFPDVAVCTTFLEGCLSQTVNCFETASFTMVSQHGFLDEDFEPNDYDGVNSIKEAYPNCAVMPLSKLTVDEAGVENGDINSFSASFFALWSEDPLSEYATSGYEVHTQFVSVFFIDIDADVESIGEEIVDVKIPYERVILTDGDSFTSTQNHMVLTLEEFSGITKNGVRKEREKTFSQSTTNAKQNWVWSSDLTGSLEVAFLQVDVAIGKFEFTSIEEVDPVDGWTIIGAIGGVWQFVVIGFGIFFVFSEKQAPDRKMRNFYKTMAKPAATINKRLSSITSSRPSQHGGPEDFEIDATDEDLPEEWVKKQTRTGSVYYYNVMTGSRTSRSPNEVGDTSGSTGAGATAAFAPPPPPPPPRSTAVHNVFRRAPESPPSGLDASQESAYGTSNGRDSDGGHLPPGWIARTDENGKLYYLDTVGKTTQWKRPTMRVHSTGGVGVQAVDIPIVQTRRGSNFSTAPSRAPAPVPAPVADVPPQTSARRRTTTAVHPAADTPSSSLGGPSTKEGGGVDGEILPPDWEMRTAPDGKKYYANNVTKKTQWKAPKL